MEKDTHVNKIEIDRLLHRCRAWLFRILANALFTPTGRSCTTCAGPGLSGAPSIGTRGNGDGT